MDIPLQRTSFELIRFLTTPDVFSRRGDLIKFLTLVLSYSRGLMGRLHQLLKQQPYVGLITWTGILEPLIETIVTGTLSDATHTFSVGELANTPYIQNQSILAALAAAPDALLFVCHLTLGDRKLSCHFIYRVSQVLDECIIDFLPTIPPLIQGNVRFEVAAQNRICIDCRRVNPRMLCSNCRIVHFCSPAHARSHSRECCELLAKLKTGFYKFPLHLEVPVLGLFVKQS